MSQGSVPLRAEQESRKGPALSDSLGRVRLSCLDSLIRGGFKTLWAEVKGGDVTRRDSRPTPPYPLPPPPAPATISLRNNFALSVLKSRNKILATVD